MLLARRNPQLRVQLRFPITSRARLSTQPPPSTSKSSENETTRQPYKYVKPPPTPESWFTRYLRGSPMAMTVFKSTTSTLGMGNTKQVSGRYTHHMYESSCISREQDEAEFWHTDCRLPETMQSWFTITNLHIWMLTVRFRALPSPYGSHYVQTLIDNFFLDVEDRVRQVLSKKAPERLVTRQLKVFREQWAGMGLSLDYSLGLSSPYRSTSPSALPDGDVEMAAAIWRNFLGARGAQGIDDPGYGKIRRSINLGGEVEAPKIDEKDKEPELILSKLEETDDGSGVCDFSGEDTILYVKYPELMYTLVRYVRRELMRLEGVSDDDIMNGRGVGKFGPIRS